MIDLTPKTEVVDTVEEHGEDWTLHNQSYPDCCESGPPSERDPYA